MADDLKKVAAGFQAKLGVPTQKPQLPAGSAADAAHGLAGMLGGTVESQRLLAAGHVEEAARLEAEATQVEVYVLADVTQSMLYTLPEVMRSIDVMASRIAEQSADTQMAVWGIQDHYDAEWNPAGLGVIPGTLVPVSQRGVLKEQIRRLRTTFGNKDKTEAYECAWAEVAKAIGASPEKRSGRETKRTIITFMETAAHGQLIDLGYMRGYDSIPRNFSPFGLTVDVGCLYKVNWRQALSAAQALANQWYVVDCNGACGSEEKYKAAKRACVEQAHPNHHLLELGDAHDIIPPLIAAMVEQTRGPASLVRYVQDLEGQDQAAAAQIAGYLPMPRGVAQRGPTDVKK